MTICPNENKVKTYNSLLIRTHERKYKRTRYKQSNTELTSAATCKVEGTTSRLAKRAVRKVPRSPAFSPRTPADVSRLTAVRRKKTAGVTSDKRKRSKLQLQDAQAVPVARELNFEDGSQSPAQVTPDFTATPRSNTATRIGGEWKNPKLHLVLHTYTWELLVTVTDFFLILWITSILRD